MEQVPTKYFELPLSKAEVLKEGKDLTVVGYGSQIYTLEWAIKIAEEQMPGLSIELIDLRTLLPWDVETVEKVGCMIVHIFNDSQFFISLSTKRVVC